MSEERKHSRFGASRIDRVKACPGSALLCEQAPEAVTTLEIAEGKAAHKAIELCLTAGFNPDELVGRTFAVDAFPKPMRIEVEPEMAEAIEPFVMDTRADCSSKGTRLYVEHPFALADYDAELWGTCDVVLYIPDTKTLIVRDYKHGVGKFVPIEGNPQPMMYGLGAMLALGEPVENISLEIYQPRSYEAAEPVRRWQTDAMTLLDFGADLIDIVDAARKPDAPLIPGDHCDFCPARGICPKLFDNAVATAGTDMIPYTGDQLPPINPEIMTPDELGRRMRMAELIRPWISGLYAYAHAEMLRGRTPTGWKPALKKTRRRWKDAELATRQAQRAFELAEDDCFTRRPISPAQLEKLVGKKTAEPFVKEYAEKPEKIGLVPLEDSRPAVAIGAESEFEAIALEDLAA